MAKRSVKKARTSTGGNQKTPKTVENENRKPQKQPVNEPQKNRFKITNLFKIAASTVLTVTCLTASRPSDPDPKDMTIGQLVKALEASHSGIPYVYDIPLEGCSRGHDINKIMASENTDFFFGETSHESEAGQIAILTLIGRIDDPDKILVVETSFEDQEIFDYMLENPGEIKNHHIAFNGAVKHGIRAIAADADTVKRKLKTTDESESLQEKINFLFYNATTESDVETLTALYIKKGQIYQDRRRRVDHQFAAAIKEQRNNPSISTVMAIIGGSHLHGIEEALKAESSIDDIVMIYVVPVDKDAMEKLREHGVFKFGNNKYVWPVYDPNPYTNLKSIDFIRKMYELPHNESYSTASEILADTGKRPANLSFSRIIEQCPPVP